MCCFYSAIPARFKLGDCDSQASAAFAYRIARAMLSGRLCSHLFENLLVIERYQMRNNMRQSSFINMCLNTVNREEYVDGKVCHFIGSCSAISFSSSGVDRRIWRSYKREQRRNSKTCKTPKKNEHKPERVRFWKKTLEKTITEEKREELKIRSGFVYAKKNDKDKFIRFLRTILFETESLTNLHVSAWRVRCSTK